MKFGLQSKSRFYRVAQVLLIYTVFVILWGAWVRISHSGDGCGKTWPLCQGSVIPEATPKKTLVEFSHRLSSGLFGLWIIYMFLVGRKLFGANVKIRRALTASLVFMITEAFLGAKLVLLGLVAGNDSPWRVFFMALHQVNSLMLTGSVALVVIYSGLDLAKPPAPVAPKTQVSFWSTWLPPFLFLILAITGAWAALSSTLFPSASLLEGLAQDFSADTHYLVRLRVMHPLLAILVGGGFALFFWLQSQQEPRELLRKSELQLAGLFVFGVFFGMITLLSLAPVWMKMGHLFLAHALWIALLRWLTLRRELVGLAQTQ